MQSRNGYTVVMHNLTKQNNKKLLGFNLKLKLKLFYYKVMFRSILEHGERTEHIATL